MWIGIVLMPLRIQNQIPFDADPDQDLDITLGHGQVLEYGVTESFVIFLANGEDLARQNETDPPIRTDPDSSRTDQT